MRASLNKKYIKNSTKLKQIARLHRLSGQSLCAAEDEASQQRCVHALGAAISGDSGAFMKDVASTVAFTRHLIGMQNLSTFNHVATLLGKAAASGLDAKCLKQAGFGPKELEVVGFRLWDIIEAGCIATDCSIVSCAYACCCIIVLSFC